MKHLFVLLTLFLAIFSSWCRDGVYKPKQIIICPKQLSVDKALEIAYRNRPSQKSYDFSIKANQEGQRAALSGYLPHIDIQNRVGTVNRSILLPKKQVFIEARQLLLSFSGPMERYRIARQETNISYARKLFDRDNIHFETESSILGLWDIQEKYNFISSLDKSSEIIFRRDKLQNQLGLIDANVWLQALTQYAQSTAQVAKYSDELNTKLTNVEWSLGIPITADLALNKQVIDNFIAESILAAYQYDANFYYQKALSNRKDLQVFDELILREEYVGNSYAKSYLPEVYLFGQMNYYAYKPRKRAQQANSSRQQSNRWVDWRVGLEFDWKFDGLGNVFNAESSRATQLAYQASRIDTVQQIKKEVYTGYDTLQSSLTDLHAQKIKFKQENNELILRQKQYEIGEISDVEMAKAETNWKQARYELITSKKKAATNYRDLLSKSGYPSNLS